MGVKGDKLTNQSNIAADFLLKTFDGFGNIRAKKMFGGSGIYYNDKMFVMVTPKGEYFFKVDENLKKEFAKKGSVMHSKMPYSSVPPEIVHHQESLLEWAQKSMALIA